MIPIQEIGEAVLVFIEQPRFEKYYTEAPSEKCREYIALSFYCSLHFYEDNLEDVLEYKKQIEDELDLEDWKHLFWYAPRNPYMGKCFKKIQELGGDEAAREMEEKDRKRLAHIETE